jgi:hypothetical protein
MSLVLEVWDQMGGPFRPRVRKYDSESRQALEALELPFDRVNGK